MTGTQTESAPDPVFAAIRRITAEVAKVEPEFVKLENPVTGLTNVDSIVLLEIVALVELEFGIEISEEDLFDHISTVGDFVEVCRKLTAITT